MRARGVIVPLPLPVRGWNTRDQLSEIEPTYAFTLDNFYPEDGYLVVRNGYTTHATNVSGAVRRLLPYASGTTTKLFASSDNAIWDVTAVGDAVSSLGSLTNGEWDSVNFATLGVPYLVAVNGADGVRTYDGSSWATQSITGATASDLKGIIAHKSRLWAIEKASLSAWYMDAPQAISGGMTEFPLGGFCTLGGELAALATWTRDGGDGPDDYFVAITTKGEVLVYGGTDPDTDFTLAGRYRIAEPLGGTRCVTRMGPTLLVLTKSGVVDMENVVAGAAEATRVTDAIEPSFQEAARDRPDDTAWQIVWNDIQNRVIVNVPTVTGTRNQYVFSPNSGAWTRLRQQNANAWATSDGNLYFGTPAGIVYLADTGFTDAGEAINADVIFSPNKFGIATEKHFRRCRLHWLATGQVAPEVSIIPDYAAAQAVDSVTTVVEAEGGLWDEAEWDVTMWSGLLRGRRIVTNLTGSGFTGALRIQVSTNGAELRLVGAEVTMEAGRVL